MLLEYHKISLYTIVLWYCDLMTGPGHRLPIAGLPARWLPQQRGDFPLGAIRVARRQNDPPVFRYNDIGGRGAAAP